MVGPRLSLRQRLLLLVTLALAPTLAVIGYNEVNLRNSRTREVHDQALRSGLLATSELERIFEGIERLLLAIGQTPMVQDMDVAGCQAYIARLQARVEMIRGIAVVDPGGRLLCRTGMPDHPVSYADRAYVRQAVSTGRFAVGDFVTGRVSGRPALPVAEPFTDDRGQLRGVILAGLDLDWLGARLRERGLPPGGALTIADRNGVIISREPFPERFVGTAIPPDFMRLVHGSAPGAEEVISQDGTRRVIGYVPAPVSSVGLYVSAGLSYENSFAAIDRGSRIGMIIATLGGLAAFLAAWIAGQRFLQRPVEGIMSVLEAWRGGDRDVRTGYASNRGELGSLGAALDRLMDEIVQRQGERDLLVHELDHRVKNNFAVMQSVAARTLKAEKVPADTIQKLGDRIVALSRAHDLLTRENFESATVDELVQGAIATQQPDGADRIDAAGPPVRLDPRASLSLAMTLHELMTNAMKYGALSGERGRIALTWALEERGGRRACAFRWEERGGPPVVAPSSRGFGTQLLERSLSGARLDYRPEGLVCTFDLPPMEAETPAPAGA